MVGLEALAVILRGGAPGTIYYKIGTVRFGNAMIFFLILDYFYKFQQKNYLIFFFDEK